MKKNCYKEYVFHSKDGRGYTVRANCEKGLFKFLSDIASVHNSGYIKSIISILKIFHRTKDLSYYIQFHDSSKFISLNVPKFSINVAKTNDKLYFDLDIITILTNGEIRFQELSLIKSYQIETVYDFIKWKFVKDLEDTLGIPRELMTWHDLLIYEMIKI